MGERIIDPIGVIVLVIIVVLAFLLSLIVSRTRTPPEGNVWRSVEAAILALLGGFAARVFIAALLEAGNGSHGAGVAIGYGFFFVPGLVDTFSFASGHGPKLTEPHVLLMFATVVGAGTGMMGGMWKIYNWEGLGWLAFPLDVTWALTGNTIGCLLHLVNFAWGKHSDETRDNAHRYARGFGLRYNPRFAFTQGAVMSNLDQAKGTRLYKHEKTHVWQARGFGPMYTLTYVAWMILWIIPSIIVGIGIKGVSGLWAGPNNWCYFNNPWEAWAYKVQNAPRNTISGVDAKDAKMIWPDKFVIAWAIPFFIMATGLAVFATIEVFHHDGPAVVDGSKQNPSAPTPHDTPPPGPGTPKKPK